MVIAITFLVIIVLTVALVFVTFAGFVGWNRRDLNAIRREHLRTEESRKRLTKMLEEKKELWVLLTPAEREWIRQNVDLTGIDL
ncbi:hypothetical protein SEA_SIXAMA_65 [Gordonia phage Sixama]|uniref:Uncharacterized protein n=1 Tax=Gordonia phage Sixama TaxID=2653271 RepID=A0A5Q2F586_9CAUD|nr:hypothetical protein PP302_gp065 [Gordonia phage Sixama]QGF20244.1 hypothetical protein SEA_SIXAMA_65 [Gordonia phage Sixama]